MMAIKRVDHQSVADVCSKQCFFLICAVVALAVTYVPGTQAQMLVLGSSINMTNLVGGQTIIVGDKAFTDFSVSGSYLPSQLTVTPIEENGNFGIRFGGALVASGNAMDAILGYQVSVTNSANLIADANLLFNGVIVNGTGLAEVVEQVFTNNDEFAGQMTVFATETTNQLFASLAITPPQPNLTINKDVLITATVPAFSSISTIDQTFTQVPEPSAVVLVVAGLSGLFLLRRRKH